MVDSRLPVLGAIVVMLVSCGVAVAAPNQPSASYFMPGCRDAASLITFSVRELVSASWGNFTAYVCRLIRLPSKPPVLSFSTSTDSLRGLTRTFALWPLRLCAQTGRVLQPIQAVEDLSPGKAPESAATVCRPRPHLNLIDA